MLLALTDAQVYIVESEINSHDYPASYHSRHH
jgi:hypothetical protein